MLLLLALFVAIGQRPAVNLGQPASSSGGGTHNTGRLYQCSSLCGVEPSIAPRSGLSP